MSPAVNASQKFKREFAKNMLAKFPEVCAWYTRKIAEAPPAFYSSVDLRDSGDKIVPVDSNLFPGGFNNICPADQLSGEEIFRNHLQEIAKTEGISRAPRILVLPENHTKNVYYAENLSILLNLIRGSGSEAELGWLSPEAPTEPVVLVTASGGELTASPISVSEDGRLRAGTFEPDLILVNNDFSAGYPEILDRVKQPLLPSPRMGWHARKKSGHFVHYNRLATEFAELIGIDPWGIRVETAEVTPVNLNEGLGQEELVRASAQMLAKLREEYKARKVGREPFLFVKNNAGTYGMGIMVIHSEAELRDMNRRTKNKMSVGKNRSAIGSLAIQEGVPTATRVDGMAAEPVIYLVGFDLLGGFLRSNTQKGEEDNLNSEGMVFKMLCMSDLQGLARAGFAETDLEAIPGERTLEIVYGAVARLSALATGYEIRDNGARHGNQLS